MDLLVLGHICFIGEIIKVTCVHLRIQLRDEWGLCLSESIPLDLGEILMLVDILDVGKSLGSRVDAAMNPLDKTK